LALAAREINRILIMMPPRHGKSSLLSQYCPGWYLGTHPDHHEILSSYESEFAASWGRKARDALASCGTEVFGVNVREETAAAHRWEIMKHAGGMITAGIGGAITGRGADWLGIDDPIKNPEEAHSAAYRRRTWEWYQGAAYPRLEPEGVVSLILTRWHEDDLAGRLLVQMDQGGEGWEVIRLPAIAEEDEDWGCWGRKKGEALWPERYPVERLLEIQKAVGEYDWSALYQQRPAPLEGGIFKREWWQYYEETPTRLDSVTQSWDMSFTDKATSSYVVGMVLGRVGPNVYVLDLVRRRMDFPETLEAVRHMSRKWPQGIVKLVESAANGEAVLATLQNEIGGLLPITAKQNKEARAYAASKYVEGGSVRLPKWAPWLETFLEEATSFPNAANDDQVDALTQAVAWFVEHGFSSKRGERTYDQAAKDHEAKWKRFRKPVEQGGPSDGWTGRRAA